jgi:hypothetical protein
VNLAVDDMDAAVGAGGQRRIACPTSPGNRRATSPNPTEAIRSSYFRQ